MSKTRACLWTALFIAFLVTALSWLNPIPVAWAVGQIRSIDLKDGDVQTVDLAAGAATVAKGGTGITTYAIGDLLYASGATTLSKLASPATGRVLVSGGVGVAPAWTPDPSVASLTASGSTGFIATGTPPANGTSANVQLGGTPVGSNTNGTYFHVNAASGFAGYLFRGQVNGSLSNTFYVDYQGTGRLEKLGVGTTANPAATLEVKSGGGTVTQNTEQPALRISTNNQVLGDSLSLSLVRHFMAVHPTFTGNPALPSTITDGVNFYIDGPPTASSGVSITNPYALQVDSGVSRLDGNVVLGDDGAKDLGMPRRTAADSAGQNLTIHPAAATSGATDKAGGDLIMQGGVGTGTAPAGRIRFQGSGVATATGTTDNTLTDRFAIIGGRNIVDNTNTNLFTINVPSGGMAGGQINWTARATDGTDFQTISGITTFSIVNKATVYTQSILTNASNTATAASTGTITATWAISATSPTATFRVAVDSSLLTTTTAGIQVSYHLTNNSPQAVTFL